VRRMRLPSLRLPSCTGVGHLLVEAALASVLKAIGPRTIRPELAEGELPFAARTSLRHSAILDRCAS
jgi:hypothetical protein